MLYSVPAGNDNNTHPLTHALGEFRQLVAQRIQSHFSDTTFNLQKWMQERYREAPEIFHMVPTKPLSDEWVVLMLALVPHLQPNFFESIILEHMPKGGDFPEFGGVRANNHRGMLPTGETAQFVLAGSNMKERLAMAYLFDQHHWFYKQQVLWLEPVKEGEPQMSGRIILAQEWVDKLLHNKEWSPKFGVDFPAQKITTEMIWDDVVLHPRTLRQVNDISTWLQHHSRFAEDENLKRKIKPGYRVLFYGPSGTGKTLTAALLGKQFGKDVYRIDLSQIVSKYIGETEKNLENVFKRAETKDWILFFDEADALFGKRTNVQSAHDKYANQEVSYLLQRVEDYPGLLILASNFKNNLDDAFIRRFHSVVHFPMPNADERFRLWNKSLPAALQHHASVDTKDLAIQYELSGASILNAVQFAVLQSYARNDGILTQADLVDGIKKEFLKEEKSV